MLRKKQAESLLTPREQAYCDEFLAGTNCVQAALKAGYAESTAKKQAFSWIKESRQASRNKAMYDYITQRREELENEYNVTKGKALLLMYRIASFDPRKLWDEDGKLKSIKELDDDTAGAIVGIDVEVITSIDALGDPVITRIKKYKAADKNAALANIAKMLGYNASEKMTHEVGESFLDLLKKTSASASNSDQNA